MRPPVAIKLDGDAERVRIDHARTITELQQLNPTGLRIVVIRDVVLPNNVGVEVPHTLGRRPAWFGPSAIRGAATAGTLSDFESLFGTVPVDQTLIKMVRALGFGATITVDFLAVG